MTLTARARARRSGPDVPTGRCGREDPGVHRLALRLVAMVLTALVAVVGVAAPAAVAQDGDPEPTVAPSGEDLPLGDIIPRPNSGQAPDSPNDPGGWQQYLVFGLILAGLATIFGLAVRESRRARARRDARAG